MPFFLEIGRAHVCTPVTPRSTLFPYTTLFRSVLTMEEELNQFSKNDVWNLVQKPKGVHVIMNAIFFRDRKSTRLHSRDTEIYTLSLHDALPICSDDGRRTEPILQE